MANSPIEKLIKSKQLSGTTTASGNITDSDFTKAHYVLSAQCGVSINCIVIPYLNTAGKWCFHFGDNGALGPIANQSVTFTVYYVGEPV